MRVRSGGGVSGDSPRAVGRVKRRGPRVGGRGMQVRGGRRSAGTGVRPDVWTLALPNHQTYSITSIYATEYTTCVT
jgi:hypothetical protein